MTDTNITSEQTASLAKLFLRRALRGDLSAEPASREERAVLQNTTASSLAQDYLAWRRSLLWVACGLLGITSVVELFGWIDILANDQGPTDGLVKLLSTILVFPVVIATWLLLGAARDWARPEQSRRRARLAWGVFFGVPLLAALVPWSMFVGDRERLQVGVVLAIALFLKIGPMVIGLCAGVVRSSMTVKTLLPESPLPGWAIVAFGPVYALLLIVVTVMIHQAQGGILSLVAVACLVGSPLIYLRQAGQLVRPHNEADIPSLRSIRNQAALLNLVGILLFGFVLFRSFKQLDVLDGVAFVFASVGSAATMTLVTADKMVELIGASWRQAQEHQNSEDAAELDRKIHELRESGLG